MWVPFELGRPLGVPNDREFQGRVLRAALALVDEPNGPVLADFPVDAPPSHGDDEPWSCALPLPPAPALKSPSEALTWKLEREIAMLRPWHDESLRSGNRTTVGTSGIAANTIEEAARALVHASLGEASHLPPAASVPLPYLLRLLADDLKAFYLEAALAKPGAPSPSSQELASWLHHQTVLGSVLYDARDRLLQSADPGEQGVARQLVPGAWSRRPDSE